MTHILTQLFLHQLNLTLSQELGPNRVEIRDYNFWDKHTDAEIRTTKNFLSTEMAVVHADGVTFSVGHRKSWLSGVKGRYPADKGDCGCSWRSAHCAVSFHYDLFVVATPLSKKYYVYLESSLYLQMCRKHKKLATQASLGEGHSEEANAERIGQDYLNHLIAKLNSIKASAAKGERKVSFIGAEEEKHIAIQNPEPDWEPDWDNEEFIAKAFKDSQNTFKAKA